MERKTGGEGQRKLLLRIPSVAHAIFLVFTPNRSKLIVKSATSLTTARVSRGQEAMVTSHSRVNRIPPSQQADLHSVESLPVEYHFAPNAPQGGHPKCVPGHIRRRLALPVTPSPSLPRRNANKGFVPGKPRAHL
jgi:hypothetical protein